MLNKDLLKEAGLSEYVVGRRLYMGKFYKRALKNMGFSKFKPSKKHKNHWDSYKQLKSGWQCHIEKKKGGLYVHFDKH